MDAGFLVWLLKALGDWLWARGFAANIMQANSILLAWLLLVLSPVLMTRHPRLLRRTNAVPSLSRLDKMITCVSHSESLQALLLVVVCAAFCLLR